MSLKWNVVPPSEALFIKKKSKLRKERLKNMEKLVDLAKRDFDLIGESLVVCLWLALYVVGFGLMLYFICAVCFAIYEWIKDHIKKKQHKERLD